MRLLAPRYLKSTSRSDTTRAALPHSYKFCTLCLRSYACSHWQHQLCKNPRPNPDIKTLFVDHTCGQPNGARAPSLVTNPLMGPVPNAGPFPPLAAHGPFQPAPALPTSIAGWMANPTPVPHPSASAGPNGLTAPNNAAINKRPANSTIDYL